MSEHRLLDSADDTASAIMPKVVIATIMDRIVPRPGHNMLAHEVIKKLDTAGYVIAPKELLAVVDEIVGMGSPSPYATPQFDKRIERARALLAIANGASQ